MEGKQDCSLKSLVGDVEVLERATKMKEGGGRKKNLLLRGSLA